jgi:hypothetical protein
MNYRVGGNQAGVGQREDSAPSRDQPRFQITPKYYVEAERHTGGRPQTPKEVDAKGTKVEQAS